MLGFSLAHTHSPISISRCRHQSSIVSPQFIYLSLFLYTSLLLSFPSSSPPPSIWQYPESPQSNPNWLTPRPSDTSLLLLLLPTKLIYDRLRFSCVCQIRFHTSYNHFAAQSIYWFISVVVESCCCYCCCFCCCFCCCCCCCVCLAVTQNAPLIAFRPRISVRVRSVARAGRQANYTERNI